MVWCPPRATPSGVFSASSTTTGLPVAREHLLHRRRTLDAGHHAELLQAAEAQAELITEVHQCTATRRGTRPRADSRRSSTLPMIASNARAGSLARIAWPEHGRGGEHVADLDRRAGRVDLAPDLPRPRERAVHGVALRRDAGAAGALAEHAREAPRAGAVAVHAVVERRAQDPGALAGVDGAQRGRPAVALGVHPDGARAVRRDTGAAGALTVDAAPARPGLRAHDRGDGRLA
jgi:hypothetical protein